MVGLFSRLFKGKGADTRILTVRVSRGMQAVNTAALGLPFWSIVTGILLSNFVGVFGGASAINCVVFTTATMTASLICRYVNGVYERDKGLMSDTVVARRWYRIVLYLNGVTSAAWGLAPWLLWDEGNVVNHVFLTFVCMGIILRSLASRSGPMTFFLAGFVPITIMLVGRCFSSGSPEDVVLGLVTLAFAVNAGRDRGWHSGRLDEEARLRFSIEDMARALEDARDEALQKRAEAEAASASKTAFLANMSHELRTPLNAILGFSEIIARECLGPIGSPRYKEYAHDIHNSGTHLLSLINDLLDVAKIEAGRMEISPETLDTEPLLDNALKFVAVRARERNQHLVIRVEAEASRCFVDERAMKQILINLVSNAVKFTPIGGRIEVAAAGNADGDFELTVTDNGAGIPQDKVDRIFKPFSQIDNRYDRQGGGTGLGLALVRGLTDLHGGRAWIESELGKGTCAHVVLPMHASCAVPRRATA